LRTGITVVWMGDPHIYAESVQEKVWAELSSRPEWQAWLEEYIFVPGRISIVFYEDRYDDRIVIRGDTLRYVVPLDDVVAAFEKHYLPDFMAHLFREVYLAWAHKAELPEPPGVADPPH
jgi:hypothetical protein